MKLRMRHDVQKSSRHQADGTRALHQRYEVHNDLAYELHEVWRHASDKSGSIGLRYEIHDTQI